MMRNLLLFLGLILLVKVANAREPFMRQISQLEGLPTQTIYDLHEDTKGYLYLASGIGLLQYNGIHFKLYPSKNALSNSVSNISEDAKGNIYCMNFSNQFFVLQNDTLIPHPLIQPIITQNSGFRNYEVIKNEIWIVMEKAVFRFNPITQKYKQVLSANSDQLFLDIAHTPNEIYITTSNSIYTIAQGKVTIKQTYKGDKRAVIHQNKLYLNTKGFDNMVFNVSDSINLKSQSKFNSVYFHSLTSTGERLWLNTSSGIYPIVNDTINTPLLTKERVSAILKDREENYWISTLDNGVYFIPNLNITKIKAPSTIHYTDNITKLTLSPAHTLICGTSKGELLEFDSVGEFVRIFETQIQNEVEFILFDNHTLLFSQGIIDYKSGRMNFPGLHLGKFMSKDSFGNYIVSTYNSAGILSSDFSSEPDLGQMSIVGKESFSIRYKIPFKILVDKRSMSSYYSKKYQKYYIAASNGFYVLDRNGNKTMILMPDSTPIIGNKIVEGLNQTLWVSTINYGLVQIENEKVLTILNSQNGLSNNSIRTVHRSGNDLWVLNTEGLDKIDLNSMHKIEHYDMGYFLKGINANDILKLGNYLYIATNQGLYKLSLSNMIFKAQPLLYLKKFTVNGKATQYKPGLPLNSGQKNIAFYLETLFFKSGGDYEYSYRLKGFDTAWRKQSSRNQVIEFLSLPYGNYNLEVKLAKENQIFEGLSFDFKIAKPYWATGLFKAFMALLILFIYIVIYKFTKNRIQKRHESDRKLVLSQITALRSQMNPHFVFNVLNSVQGLIYSNKKSEATEYLGKFSDLMRQTLDISDKATTDLTTELKTLELYIELEAARFNNDFSYKIEIDNQIIPHLIYLPSMIIQPFVENAIKHGLLHKKGEKHLYIRINPEGDTLHIQIEDNGIGREASHVINQSKRKNHTSFASKAIQNRIELLNQQLEQPIQLTIKDIVNNHNIVCGTLVSIIIPLEDDKR